MPRGIRHLVKDKIKLLGNNDHEDIDGRGTLADILKHMDREDEKNILSDIQTLLWQLGGEVSQNKVGGHVKNPIEQEHVDFLEESIDEFDLNGVDQIIYSFLQGPPPRP